MYIDFNMRDGYIKYQSTEVTFIMTKNHNYWEVFIYDHDFKFKYYGNHCTNQIYNEVLKRIENM